MPDSQRRLDGPAEPEDATEYDVDVKALSPWPRLQGRPRRTTYRQVFAWSWVALAFPYVALALLLVFEPGRAMEPADRKLVPTLLVVMPILAILADALTALVISTVWWLCWASWNPHVSDLPATHAAPDLGQ